MAETPTAEELADLFEQAFNQTSTLILHRGREYTASGCFRGQRPRSRSAERPTLRAALLALLRREPKKKCPSCRCEKLFSQYTIEKDRYDGLCPRCRDCDRERARAKRARRAA